MAAETFGIAASALAVVELSAKVVQKCTQYTQGVLGAKADIERITREVKGLGQLAASIQQLSSKSPAELNTLQRLQPLLTQCQSRLTEIQAGLEPGKRQTAMTKLGLRALTWPFKSKDMEKIIADLHRLTQLLSDAMQVDQTAILLDIEQRAVLEKLPVADGAAYDSHANEHSPQCLPNTRVEVLHEITQWAEDPSTQPVFWLNGMAGTGKSTIARTFASTSKDEGRLGATFFFKRGEGDRGGTLRLFPTIASQLIQQVPSLAVHIQKELKKDDQICKKTLQEQFYALVKRPISNIWSKDSTSAPCFIIIDALDECERPKDIETIVQLFSKQEAGPVQLKFFLTSRPEIPARVGFNSAKGTYQTCILQTVADPVIEQDITTYLEHELREIRDRFNKAGGRQLPTKWPAEADILALAAIATPLFISASTICRYIDEGPPDDALNWVLQYKTGSEESQLGATYLPILDRMVDDTSSSRLEFKIQRFHQVVGSIVTLAEPLSVSALAQLLDIPAKTIDDVLRWLHSVLVIPKSRQEPVRMLHLSFRDFLINRERQGDRFWINEKETHRQVASACLTALKNYMSSTQVEMQSPQYIKYACRYWVSHLHESAVGGSLAAQVWDFCRDHVLCWLEELASMGEILESFNMLKTLYDVFTGETEKHLSELLEDTIRFIQVASFPLVRPKESLVYSLASAISPINSIIRGLHEKELEDWAFMGHQRPMISAQLEQVSKSCAVSIKSVSFSPNGDLMSFANTDSTVMIWSTKTGDRLQTLTGHSGAINAVSFSPDSSLAASASSDKAVILWSLESGRSVQTLQGHSEPVDAVAFSPNGKFVVSKSALPEILLWGVDEFGHWTMLRILWSGEPHSSGLETHNLLFTIDTNDGCWELSHIPTRPYKTCVFADCTVYQTESEGLAAFDSIASNGSFETFGILSQTRNVAMLLSPNEFDRCQTARHSAHIGTVICKSNGQLAVLVSSDSTVILWSSHPLEFMFARCALVNVGVDSYVSSDSLNYPSGVTDTTGDRMTLVAFSPDSSKVACIIR